jgi:regulator of protease activity HflC (stomatin/prohibitin superfamily)
LNPGTAWFFDPFRRVRVDLVSRLKPWLIHDQLDQIVKSGRLADLAVVLEVQDHQRALVWIDQRFNRVLTPGRYVYWTSPGEVRVEVVETRSPRFEHPELKTLLRHPEMGRTLDITVIERDHAGVLFIDGRYVETLPPGSYAFWKGAADVRIVTLDLRESQVDVGGQEIMTADKVTLRVNAVVTFKVTDPRRALGQSDDLRQSLYREAQLLLRGVIGVRELDQLLVEKDAVARELEEGLRRRATEMGLEVVSVGIRDLILPGDMKELMNKVTAARKLAEANLIARREETAAIRSQANTAKLLMENPTLMRLRELEVLEKIASTGELKVLLADKGLVDRVTNML